MKLKLPWKTGLNLGGEIISTSTNSEKSVNIVDNDSFIGLPCTRVDCDCPGFSRVLTPTQEKASRNLGTHIKDLYPQAYVTCKHCLHGDIWHSSKSNSKMHAKFVECFERSQIGVKPLEFVEGPSGNKEDIEVSQQTKRPSEEKADAFVMFACKETLEGIMKMAEKEAS